MLPFGFPEGFVKVNRKRPRLDNSTVTSLLSRRSIKRVQLTLRRLEPHLTIKG